MLNRFVSSTLELRPLTGKLVKAARPVIEQIESRILLTAIPDVLGIEDGSGTPVSGDFTDFGTIPTGGSFSRKFTIVNRGDTDLNVSNLKIVDLLGNPSSSFQVTEGISPTIAAGVEDTFTIRFSTTTPGVAERVVQFDTNGTISTFDFHVIGEAIAPPQTINGTSGPDSLVFNGNNYVLNGVTTTITGSPSAITINGLGGADIISILKTVSGTPVTVDGGLAVDSITVGNGDVTKLLSPVSVVGGGNGDALTVNDSTAPVGPEAFSIIDAGGMNIHGAGISFSGMQFVTVNLSNNIDSLQVTSVGLGQTVTVNSNGGADFWEIGQTPNAVGANLEQNIQGRLVANGGSNPVGQGDSFSLNNFDDPTNNSFNLGAAALTQSGNANLRIDYVGMEDCSFNLSDASDFVDATFAPIPVNYLMGGGLDTILGGPQNDVFSAGDQSVTISGGGGDDNITGSGSADSLEGNEGNDTIDAGDGNDTLSGYTGNDYLIGGNGNDTYIFENSPVAENDDIRELSTGGTDTLDFSLVSTAVTAQPINSSVQATYLNHTINGDIIQSGEFSSYFEKLIGGSAGDKLTGNNSNNTLIGNGGNDTLVGIGGNDSLVGNAGNDSLDGGSGSDTAVGGDNDDTYRFAAGNSTENDVVTELNNGGTDTLTFSTLTIPVTVNLGTDTLATHTNRTLKTGAAGQFAFFENATGGSGADKITGNAAINTLVGNAGADSLVGGDSDDRLDGGEGNDTMAGGNGRNTYVFANATAAQTDKINQMSVAFDILDFSAVTTGVSVNMTSATIATQTNRTVVSTVAGGLISFYKVFGGSGNDTMVGDTNHNELYGNAGNDSLSGGNGLFDSLLGGDGNDTLIGGSTQDIMYGNAGDDSLAGNGGDDQMYGGNSDITTGLGNDTLNGGEGSDTMFGTPGNTTYQFGNATAAQTDKILEYATTGTDTLDFSSATNSVNVNLTGTAVGATLATMTNRTVIDLGNVASANMEKVIGGSAADTIVGNALANSIVGNGGNDTITGGEGSDTLAGGLGDDTYKFANATAVQTDLVAELAGQGTADVLDFSGATVGVTINLASDTLATQTNRTVKTSIAGQFANIENATGGSGADKITGNSASNTLIGNAGNDTLTGGNGIDKLLGGDNNDQLFGLDGSKDTLDGGNGVDTISSSDAIDVKLNIP